MTIYTETYDRVKGHGRVVHHQVTAMGFDVWVFKKGERYAVQYGKQLDVDMSYGEACRELGEAIMHGYASE